MDRPSRIKKTVNYSDFQDDDDEDFACAKPPPKKARMTDPDSEKSSKTTSTPANGDVDLTGSESRKRVSLDAKRYERDLEEALTLSLLETSKTQDGEPITKTDGRSADIDDGASGPPLCSPPVLIHCSADVIHPAGDDQPRPESPPVLSNCSIDGRSLGLNIISMDSSPPKPSKRTESSDNRRKSQKEKNDKDDDDYQPQNTPDSESDADFTEEDEDDESFTVKKKKDKVVKQKTEKKATPAGKEKKDKKPTKAVKAKSTAPSPSVCRSPAAPVCVSKKTPSTPPISKPALCSSPAGAKPKKWNPPGMVGRSPGASQNGSLKSPGQGLRLGLSRLARVKPLHPNVAAN